MISIPILNRKYKKKTKEDKHIIQIIGKIGKIYKNLIEELMKFTLIKEKVKNQSKIEIVICNENEIAQYNLKYLNKKGATDIIAVISNEYLDEETLYIGAIFLNLKIIKENAKANNCEYIEHLAHLTVHSTLHLLGYEHENNEEKRKIMEAKEVIILSKLGIKSPYLK